MPSHDGDDIMGIEPKGRGDICGHLVTVLHGDDVQAVSLAEIQRLYRQIGRDTSELQSPS